MLDSGQAQVIANAINTLANVLAKPHAEPWRQAFNIRSAMEQLKFVAEELEGKKE